MKKRVYVSADYSADDGDRDVVDVLNGWSCDNWRKVEFVDMAAVKSGSVSGDSDCRPCDLKSEFNKQINASSAAIFIVGDKTASRTAGSNCSRMSNSQNDCRCTPYKQNTNGAKMCKVVSVFPVGPEDNVGEINSYSYLRHEFEQAKKKGKTIIILYNSMKKELLWLPPYMEDYKENAYPFWIKDAFGNRVGNYSLIKEALGYD